MFLTSISSKLIGHVIASQFMDHLNANNILYVIQHGCQDKYLFETQILILVHELAHDVDANKLMWQYWIFCGVDHLTMLGKLIFSEIGPKQFYSRLKLPHQCQ